MSQKPSSYFAPKRNPKAPAPSERGPQPLGFETTAAIPRAYNPAVDLSMHPAATSPAPEGARPSRTLTTVAAPTPRVPNP